MLFISLIGRSVLTVVTPAAQALGSARVPRAGERVLAIANFSLSVRATREMEV